MKKFLFSAFLLFLNINIAKPMEEGVLTLIPTDIKVPKENLNFFLATPFGLMVKQTFLENLSKEKDERLATEIKTFLTILSTNPSSFFEQSQAMENSNNFKKFAAEFLTLTELYIDFKIANCYSISEIDEEDLDFEYFNQAFLTLCGSFPQVSAKEFETQRLINATQAIESIGEEFSEILYALYSDKKSLDLSQVLAQNILREIH